MPIFCLEVFSLNDHLDLTHLVMLRFTKLTITIISELYKHKFEVWKAISHIDIHAHDTHIDHGCNIQRSWWTPEMCLLDEWNSGFDFLPQRSCLWVYICQSLLPSVWMSCFQIPFSFIMIVAQGSWNINYFL